MGGVTVGNRTGMVGTGADSHADVRMQTPGWAWGLRVCVSVCVVSGEQICG
jgi:hypothetical protein